MDKTNELKQVAVLAAFLTVLSFPLFWYLITFYRGVFFPPGVTLPSQVSQWFDWLAAANWVLLAWHAAIQFILLRNGRVKTAIYSAYAAGTVVPVVFMASVFYVQNSGVA